MTTWIVAHHSVPQMNTVRLSERCAMRSQTGSASTTSVRNSEQRDAEVALASDPEAEVEQEHRADQIDGDARGQDTEPTSLR